MIELGVRARDKFTGFTGTVVAKTTWITGCDRYVIQPSVDKDGKLPDAESFDETRIEVIQETKTEIQDGKIGGPQREPKQL